MTLQSTIVSAPYIRCGAIRLTDSTVNLDDYFGPGLIDLQWTYTFASSTAVKNGPKYLADSGSFVLKLFGTGDFLELQELYVRDEYGVMQAFMRTAAYEVGKRVIGAWGVISLGALISAHTLGLEGSDAQGFTAPYISVELLEDIVKQ